MQTYVSKTGVDDMTMLTDISNGGITDNLKKRYEKDQIYVRCVVEAQIFFFLDLRCVPPWTFPC
jgi:hypothetical protein